MNNRYYSLDVFRGMTVALMILVNNPGTWSYIFDPLEHAEWHGLTPTDLVFPFFLFAVGNAMAFVLPKFKQQPQKIFWQKVLKRTVLIFAIGLFLNWFPFLKWDGDNLIFKAWVDAKDATSGIRIMGVLQRIAICYFFAMVLAYFLKTKQVIVAVFAILFGYWLMVLGFGKGDPYSLEGWFGSHLDQNILGLAHIYKGEGRPFDPEGLVSTLPSIAQVLLGYLVGMYVTKNGQLSWLWPKTPTTENGTFRMLSGLMVSAFILHLIALFWNLEFPFNKKIWSSTYVLETTALAGLLLGTFIWLTDVQGWRNWLTKFFDVFGKNPLFVFVMSGLLPRALNLIRIPKGVSAEGLPEYQSPQDWFYNNILSHLPGPPEVGSFAYALCFLVLMWALAWWLDRRKIYVKV